MSPEKFPHRSAAVPGRLLLNEREAADAMGCSTRKLFELRAAGELPHVPLGNRVMYDPADLQRWIDANKVKAGTAAKPAEGGL